MAGSETESYELADIFGLHARAEAGAQFVGRSGFRTDLGLAFLVFRDRDDKQRVIGWPIFHFGWVW
jgi:hypothetical protein